MYKSLFPLLGLLALCSCTADKGASVVKTELKPRLVVMTDIGPADVEPDDNESAVRLMSYADRFEIEAICTTIGWNCDPYPEEWAEYLYRVVDAYGKDVSNLMKRSGQTGFKSIEEENNLPQELGYWPSMEYVRSRCFMGSKNAGIGVIGEGNDSEGSEMLIKLADEDDPRPIWVTSWGGSNTLAQAIWKVQHTRTPEELKKFIQKFRIYTITDQDMQWSMRMQRDYSSHMWMRKEYKDDLKFVWDESAWLNQNALGVQNWEKYATLIQNHGEMGKVYPKYLWGVEGDTPSFLNVMPNGLNDPEDPTQVGWGGYHLFGISPDSITYSWTNWEEPTKSSSDAYEKKFYPDEFNDFAARMAWANDGTGNTNPVLTVNGESGITPLYINTHAGETITLDATGSHDPEGDNLSFSWWIQKEISAPVTLTGTDTPIITVSIPNDAQGKAHVICEVRDDGDFNLVSYKRIIIEIE